MTWKVSNREDWINLRYDLIKIRVTNFWGDGGNRAETPLYYLSGKIITQLDTIFSVGYLQKYSTETDLKMWSIPKEKIDKANRLLKKLYDAILLSKFAT
jgi:hypothetical protein